MPSIKGAQGRTYWRSLSEVEDTPEFRALVEREFPKHDSEWLDNKSGDSRRAFLKVMGASIALAGLASCRRWPGEDLVPYSHRPAGRMDGVPVHYATACEVGGMGIGVMALSFDGRPIKVDGHPTHPLTMGSSDIFLQASVLNVYDPDRSRGVVKRTAGKREESTWERFAEEIKKTVPADGAGLVVLAEASRSPSVSAMRKKLSRAQWFEWEPVSEDQQRAGAQLAFGKPLRAVPQLDKAAVIVSIDADLFHGEPLSIKYNRDFAAGRRLHDSKGAAGAAMNRLYMIEAGFSITGSMADHRRGVKPSEIAAAVQALAHEVAGGDAVTTLPVELAGFISVLAKDLLASKRKAVIVAGSRQSPEIHAAVAAMNAALNAPVDYYAETDDPRGDAWTRHAAQIKAFAEAAARADAFLVLGANPALTAPADLAIGELLQKAKVSIHAGTHEDETAQACQWHVPLAHFLEAWGDVRTLDGTVSIAQPLIEPIFGARSAIEILSLIAGDAKKGQDIVRETAKSDYLSGRYSEWMWKKALFDGIIADTAWPKQTPGAAKRITITATPSTGFELAPITGAVHDGRYANNGWLMELPNPMTRVAWENPVILSPATASELGVDGDDVIRLIAGGRTIEATVYVLPGQPDKTLSLAVGYGRAGLGDVADGIGANAYELCTSANSAYVANVIVARTGKVKPLACVQDHHVIDPVGKNRILNIVPELVVEGTLEQYRKNPALGARRAVSLSIFDEYSYEPGQPHLMAKWGMAIDLTTCTGCSACVTACQAENNIPVVGREMVWRGREMHWIRIDRYFKWGRNEKTGEVIQSEPPQVVHQPLMCVHCENAPCEEVCPVAATTHSHEGLNMMTYNRCIGTRYCSNNCPYKVRRFNYFDYNAGTRKNLYVPNLLRDDMNDLDRMQKNPQVTIRSRGVMEKCTYCVQRIETARIKMLAENRSAADKAKFADGSVVTACQQACPTQAIVFGDLNDKDSRVAKLHALAQGYKLLDPELNTKPRTQYLAKVRNPVGKMDEPGRLDEALYNEHTASEGFEFEAGNAGGKKD